MSLYTINDSFQNYISTNFKDIKSYNLLADIIIFGLLGYTYYISNIDHINVTTKLFKYIIIFFILRYVLNLITNYTLDAKDTKPKTYFQLNSHVAIFAIIILTNTLLSLNVYTTYALIISYTLFISAIKYGYTVDNLVTLLVVYNLLQIHI
jgi:hypothetical protein